MTMLLRSCSFVTLTALCFTVQTEARLIEVIRNKRQGLSEFTGARTTDKPLLDVDESSGIYLEISDLGLTSAPAIDNFAADTIIKTTPKSVTGLTGTTQQGSGATKSGDKPGVTPLKTISCPSCAGGTMGVTLTPPPSTTTYPGYLVGSPYPFVLPPVDIPFYGSKYNGPWGFPGGHYQGFRGTGQYIIHYQYYPLSYFGSAMIPYRYSLSGKK